MGDNSNKCSHNVVNQTGPTWESFSLGGCSVSEHRTPSRHPTTATVKWTKEISIVVMECYYESRPIDDNGVLLRGYRQIIHKAWRERGMFVLTEEKLCDQAWAIRKNECFTMVELEEIKKE